MWLKEVVKRKTEGFRFEEICRSHSNWRIAIFRSFYFNRQII